jgi:outer membrane protein OmpA-like peptidoglycan-associated protein
MYEYDDDGDGEEGGRSAARTIGILAVVVVLALVGWFVVRPRLDSDDASNDSASRTTAADGSRSTAAAEAATGSDPTAATGDTADAGTPGASTSATTTEPPVVSTATTVAPATTLAPTTTPTTAPPPPKPVTYATLVDGTPQPILGLFAADRITITGAVPDQAAKDRMQALAVANAKPGQAGVIDNQLTIDPNVPIDIGVRVVELTSARFPPASADILPEHAAELDRVATIMEALPNISVLVIGHADQRGEEQRNLLISAQRAEAVVDYLASRGVDPARMASRAVGEADLLTLDNEPAALALNRRTEFVFYGLLVP